VLESICGVVDDSQAVEQYDGTLGVSTAFVAGHQWPVAQVQWNGNLGSVFTNPGNVSGVRWGSGTMIGPDLFLACGHLFDTSANGWTLPLQNGTTNTISPQQIATNMHLNFEYQVESTGTLRAEQSFPIVQLLEYRLGGLDMSLCRIGGSPGNTYGWTEWATTNPAVGDMLAIIGHPAGMPKRIEAGPATEVTGTVIRYNDIDTLGGNSGSGILHAATGRLVGVHTNGGCNAEGTGSNSGVAIAAIVAASPTLQALTPSSSTGNGFDLGGVTILGADVGNTLFGADTVHARDTGLQDIIGTALSVDILTTVRAADTGARDILGTPLGADLATLGGSDDPGFDPGFGIADPPFLGAGVRPFVQAGPHAGLVSEAVPAPQAGGQTAAGEVTVGALLRTELEHAISLHTAALASLQSLREALETLDNGAAG
jgi:V8-like Glu-specific endopeptidase